MLRWYAVSTKPLLDVTMRDGSRHFVVLPETYDVDHPQWGRLRSWVGKLSGACVIDFVTDHVTEAWIDFTYEGHRFSINNQCNEWWFFVDDPSCPDAILRRVTSHFELVLDREAKR
jgi:hypothetical protein